VVGGQSFDNFAPVMVADNVTSVTFLLHVANGNGSADTAFAVFTL
jgi:hypothetical protein